MSVDTARAHEEEQLLIEEADAWFQYKEDTEGLSDLRYQEAEPWAWAKLEVRLSNIALKKERLLAA